MKRKPAIRTVYEHESGDKRVRLHRSDGMRLEMTLDKDETKARRICYQDNQKRFPIYL